MACPHGHGERIPWDVRRPQTINHHWAQEEHVKIRCTDCEDIKAQGFLCSVCCRGTSLSWNRLTLPQNLRSKLFLNTAKLLRWHNSQLSTCTKSWHHVDGRKSGIRIVWGSCWSVWYGELSSEKQLCNSAFLVWVMGQQEPLKLKGHQIPMQELWVVCDESGEFDQTSQAVEHVRLLYQCIWRSGTGRRRRITWITLCDVSSLDWGSILTPENMLWFWACSWLWWTPRNTVSPWSTDSCKCLSWSIHSHHLSWSLCCRGPVLQCWFSWTQRLLPARRYCDFKKHQEKGDTFLDCTEANIRISSLKWVQHEVVKVV